MRAGRTNGMHCCPLQRPQYYVTSRQQTSGRDRVENGKSSSLPGHTERVAAVTQFVLMVGVRVRHDVQAAARCDH